MKVNEWERKEMAYYIELGLGWEDIIVLLRPRPLFPKAVFELYFQMCADSYKHLGGRVIPPHSISKARNA
jgi:hypothetical protein